jgi:transposase-like protein
MAKSRAAKAGSTSANKRKNLTASRKGDLVLLLLSGDKTIQDIATEYGKEAAVVGGWKKAFEEGGRQALSDTNKLAQLQAELDEADRVCGQLHRKIRRLEA